MAMTRRLYLWLALSGGCGRAQWHAKPVSLELQVETPLGVKADSLELQQSLIGDGRFSMSARLHAGTHWSARQSRDVESRLIGAASLSLIGDGGR